MAITVMQGDQYDMTLILKDDTGTIITADDVDEIVFSLSSIEKKFSEGGVVYDAEAEAYSIRLLQTETRQVPRGVYTPQVRVKFQTSDDIYGVDLASSMVTFVQAVNKEII